MPSDVVVRGATRQIELAWPLWLAQGLIPPDPAGVIPAAIVPPPPPVGWYADPVAALTRLWATRFLSGPMRKRRIRFREERNEHLRCAVAAFAATEIPPGAWVAWTADDWRGRMQCTGAAPINYVYGAARLCDPDVLGLYVRCARNYAGGSVLRFSRAQRTLIEVWGRMRREILVGAQTDDAVRATVTKHFPPGRYDRLLAHAQAEATTARATLAECVADGDCIW